MKSPLSLYECCILVRAECPDSMAQTYASAWIDGRVAERATEYGIPLADARGTQIAYILSNIIHWRGGNAKLVRENLKRLQKESQNG
jgi:hypothetical protein